MAFLKRYSKTNSTILRVYHERKKIEMSPFYQRSGEIWNLEKRQLLIDSILNDFDIPKIYFHETNTSQKFKYSVIDGKQRLETIWKFIENEFPLASDFEYFSDNKVKAGNMFYSDIAQKYPELKSLFDSCDLPIICIMTNDLNLIDDMFLRLNEAVPLNAAEKRSAIRGPMTKSIMKISNDKFFTRKVKFKNNRYQYREVSARILFLTWTLNKESKIFDTKKIFLDNFVKEFKKKKMSTISIEKEVIKVLEIMYKVFFDADNLLKSQSTIPIFYLVFREAIKTEKQHFISRQKLSKFFEDIRHNKIMAETDISKANYDLLDFDRLSIQGTNDASSIKERLRILKEYLQL